jgi:predicted permease
LLALAGGAAGIALAAVGVELIRTLGLGTARDSFAIAIDARVLAFAFAAAVITGLLFGLFPVISLARGRPIEVLKEGGRGSGGSRSARSTRRVLAVVQMAMAVTLLAGAGLLIRSFVAVQHQNPGFSTDNVLSATIDLPESRYKDAASQTGFYDRLLDEARALPGVKSAGLVSSVPFSGNDGSASYLIDGVDPKGGLTPHGYVQMVDEDFFSALQIPILQGRSFARSDGPDAPRVAVIDELLAQKYFHGENAIGKRIAFEFETTDAAKTKWMTIVGVVPTIKHDRLSEQTIKETIYFYYRQQPFRTATLALRTEQAPETLVAPLRAALLRVDPDQPVYDIRTMTERVALSLDDRRTPMLLLMLFAAVALALSAIGIYGVLAFSVASRTGELGVRMSIGASSADILKLVLADGARLAATGLAIGLAGSLALSQLIKTQLFGVGIVDPLTLAGVVAVLVATAFVACWLPARRAARIAPIEALRYE